MANKPTITSAAHIRVPASTHKPKPQLAIWYQPGPKISGADLVIRLPAVSGIAKGDDGQPGHAFGAVDQGPLTASHGADKDRDVPWERAAQDIALDRVRGGLHELLAGLSGVNRNDQVLALIDACLDEGVNTRKGIVDMLGALGFKREHVCILLQKETGSTVGRHCWKKDVEGLYSSLGG